MASRLALLAVPLLVGCTPTAIRDTTTIHNADATRIWVVQRTDVRDRVVVCDLEFLRQKAPLCRAWPGDVVVSPDGDSPRAF